MKNQNAKFNLDVCMQFSPLCMGEQSYLLTKGDACWLQPIRNSHKWLPFLPAKVFFFFFSFLRLAVCYILKVLNLQKIWKVACVHLGLVNDSPTSV